MSLQSLSDMTGMPTGKKKTHRGKRSRGHGPKPSTLPPAAATHHAALNAAIAADDHKGAKSSAFHLVNALHALGRPKTPAEATVIPSPSQNPGLPIPNGDGLSMNGMDNGVGKPSPFLK